MIVVHKFKVADGMAIQKDICERTCNNLCTEEMLEAGLKYGPAFTAFDGRTVIACAGIGIINKGIGHAWALYSAKAHPVTLARAVSLCRSLMQLAMSQYKLKELHATARADLPNADRYLKFLGFERIGETLSRIPDKSLAYCYLKRG